VPKHGYRFIAPVERLEGPAKGPDRGTTADPWREFLLLGGAGTFGGAAAGAIGGLVYGFAAASQSAAGAISVLLVLLSVTILVAVIGGAGVSFAIAACAFARQPSWQLSTLAGAAGGLITGAIGKLLGHDAFALLVGRAPGEITGAMEGILVGAGVGLGAGLALRSNSLRRGTAVAALTGGLAGVSIALLGGRLMLGSLVLLEQNYPASSLRLGVIAHLFGEERFGPITNMISTTLEGALFAAFVVSAMVLARQSFDRLRA
jgi:hypothetical protein